MTFWKKGPICAHSSLIQGGLKFIYIYRLVLTCSLQEEEIEAEEFRVGDEPE